MTKPMPHNHQANIEFERELKAALLQYDLDCASGIPRAEASLAYRTAMKPAENAWWEASKEWRLGQNA